MRTTFDNLDPVIDLSKTFLVMGVTDRPLTDDFSVERMSHFTRHFDAKCLRRFRARYYTDKSLFQRTTLYQASISRSRRIVRIFAMLRRNCMRLGPVSS